MSFTAITTSIRYLSDGSMAAWPIPFPFGQASEVAVKTINEEGQERRLSLGQDFVIQGSCVVAVVPVGQSIVIWLNAPVETAVQGASARVMASSPVSAPVVVRDAGSSAVPTSETADMAGLLAQLSAQVAELQQAREDGLAAARAAEADAQVRRLTSEGTTQAQKVADEAALKLAEATNAIEATARELLKELAENGQSATTAAARAESTARQAARTANEARDLAGRATAELTAAAGSAEARLAAAAKTAGSAVRLALSDATAQVQRAALSARNSLNVAAKLGSADSNAESYWAQAGDLATGSLLTLPGGLVYYPGRAMLRVSYQGSVLANGVHFEEVGDADTLSDTIRILFPSRDGDQWSFWVVASNSSRTAEAAAQRAEQASHEAQQAARQAVAGASGVTEAAGQARDAAANAGRWYNAVIQSASDAADLAECAWKAAYQASMAATQPGIAAVQNTGELAHCVSGVYIVNPHLTHTPTIFMGIWPVDGITAMTWDGVFFIGPAYPDKPTPPPVPCPLPDRPEPDIPTSPGTNPGTVSPPPATTTRTQWKPCMRA